MNKSHDQSQHPSVDNPLSQFQSQPQSQPQPQPQPQTASVSALLHHRAVRDEYETLANVVREALVVEAERERQEAVRIRVESMLIRADPSSLRVLQLALRKCNTRLDSLASAARPVDDARARMRVIESKHFHGARCAAVAPELRALHIRRGAQATLVDHIHCALYDQVRIHYLLIELSARVAHLRALLGALDRASAAASYGAAAASLNFHTERSDRHDDLALVAAGSPLLHHSYHRALPNSRDRRHPTIPMTRSYGGSTNSCATCGPASSSSNGNGRGRGSRDGSAASPSSNAPSGWASGRTSFSADTLRRASIARRTQKQHPIRSFQSHDAPDVSTTSGRCSSSADGPKSQSFLSRRGDTGLIPHVVRRALSYDPSPSANAPAESQSQSQSQSQSHSQPQSRSPACCTTDEPSWWADTPSVTPSSLSHKLQQPRALSPPSEPLPLQPQRLSSPARCVESEGSGVCGRARRRTEQSRECGPPSGSAGRSHTHYAKPWRWRSARPEEEPDQGVEDDCLLPVSPVSYSAGSDQATTECSAAAAAVAAAAVSRRAVLGDVESLCTEVSSVLSSSRGMEDMTGGSGFGSTGRTRRRGSLSSGFRHDPNNSSGGYRHFGSSSGGGVGRMIRNGGSSGRGMRTVGRLGLGRLRVQAQAKRLWTDVNELYSVVLTHGPHLVEEKIVPRSSVDTGLLGSWHAGKGQGASLRLSFQAGIVTEAARKVESIVAWQHRLVVAIRRDLFEQRKALRHSDTIISDAYLAAMAAQPDPKSLK